MKYVIVSMFALLVWVPKIVRAQVIVKTGYISSSSYKGENGRQTGGKGAVRTYEQRTTIRYQVSEISAFYPDCW